MIDEWGEILEKLGRWRWPGGGFGGVFAFGFSVVEKENPPRKVDGSSQFNYNAGYMASDINLGEFEQLILLAILRLGDRAYGVTIRAEIAERAGRAVAPGALYTALDRLEDKGHVKSRVGEPSPQRGGRAKRFFTVTISGTQALVRAQRAFQQMLEGLDVLRGAHV